MSRFRFFIIILVILTGCSKKGTPVVILASNGDGNPEFWYEGPGMYSYKRSFESFTFQIGPVSGKPFVIEQTWVTGSGELKVGDSNDMVISIQSESDRDYDIRLLGVSTNRNEVPEAQTVETLHVPAGKQSLKVERFLKYTYKHG